MAWVWWLGAALVLAVVEILSLDLVLIMFAGGALGASLLAALGAPLWLQILTFALSSAALLVVLRPWLLRHLRRRVPLVETNAAALVGRTAVVVSEVTERSGRIKLAGEVWSARTEDGVLTEGQDVQVLRIDGATAVVTAYRDAEPHRRPQLFKPPAPYDRPSEETAL